MTTAFAIKIIGLFLGVVACLLIPWRRRLTQGEAGGQGGASATGIVPGFENYFRLFCLAFGFGFGWNAIVLEAGKWGNWFLEGEE